MEKTEAISKLKRQKGFIGSLNAYASTDPTFQKWHRDTQIAIENIFGRDTRHIKDFTAIVYFLSPFTNMTPGSAFVEAYRKGLRSANALLDSFIDEINEYWEDNKTVQSDQNKTTKETNSAELPNKITIHWLLQNVPISFWLWFISLLVTAVIIGISIGQTTFIQELLGNP